MARIRMAILPVVREGHWWELVPLCGKLQGITVAYAEGVSIRDVTLTNPGLAAYVDAIWGAEVLDIAQQDNATLMSLGINKPFDTRSRNKIELINGAYHWADPTLGVEPLTNVAFMNLWRKNLAGRQS